jgi:peptide/nickel transport system permease protein
VGRRYSRPALAAGAVVAALAVAGAAASLLAPYDPTRQFDLVALQNRPPSTAHPLGTDPFARDVLSRALHGARASLGVAALGATVAAAVGALWGAAAAGLGGPADRVLMRLVDAVLGVPRVLLLLAVAAVWGAVPAPILAVALGLTAWPGTARVVRARLAALRDAEFARAARALGASPARVAIRHLAPHAASSVGVSATLLLAELLALEAGLGFLGLGVRPPDASWGSMLQDGMPYLATAPWTALVPAACIVAAVLGATVLGDHLADRARPNRPD